MPTWQEWIAGTHPTNPASVFQLFIALTNGTQLVVAIPTIQAGPEYEGQSRYYSLEAATNLTQGAWFGIPGWTHLPGFGQTLIRTNDVATNGVLFYRSRIELQ